MSCVLLVFTLGMKSVDEGYCSFPKGTVHLVIFLGLSHVAVTK